MSRKSMSRKSIQYIDSDDDDDNNKMITPTPKRYTPSKGNSQLINMTGFIWLALEWYFVPFNNLPYYKLINNYCTPLH